MAPQRHYFEDLEQSPDLGRLALRGGVAAVASTYGSGVLQIAAAIILARLLTPAACDPRRIYVHRLPTTMLLAMQRLAHTMPSEDQLRWRRWISERGSITDPARTTDDPAPGVAEFILEALAFLRHPRAYPQSLLKAPN